MCCHDDPMVPKMFPTQNQVTEPAKLIYSSTPSVRYTALQIASHGSSLVSSSRSSNDQNELVNAKKLPEELLARFLKNEVKYENFRENYEIIPKNLIISDEHLGDGNFGIVKKGWLLKNGKKEQPVAVKTSKNPEDTREKNLFIAELTVMCAIGTIRKHPCLLALIGGITIDPCKIVMEYVDGGDLLKKLRKSKNNFRDLLFWNETENGREKTDKFREDADFLQDDENLESFSTFDLISFAYQIAKGMKFLATIPCVHRDLALRNILISRDGTVKIGDFGLARKHQNKYYYRPQTPNQTSFPILWTAPECIEEEKFTEKSDVWSFGICLFELFSLGETPLVNGKGLFETDGFLPEPKFCPSRIYHHMKYCWERNPDFRPNFSACTDFFRGHLKNCSVEGFKKVHGKACRSF